jgi:3-phenylpropionate/cinnamic acid dioxygenase small subunit
MTMTSISPELQLEVQTFLFREAMLLEELRFREWLALLAGDVRYIMPVRRLVQPKSGAENHAPEEIFPLFDDDKSSLVMRVQRLETGVAHAEIPPSVTQRLISNILVEPSATGTDLIAHSRFAVHQLRRRAAFTFYGKRRDHLRRENGALKLVERRIELAEMVLPATISIFF